MTVKCKRVKVDLLGAQSAKLGSKKQFMSLFQRFLRTWGNEEHRFSLSKSLWNYLFWTHGRSGEARSHPVNQIASFAKLGRKSILQEVVVEAVLQLTAESANSSCLGMWNLIAVRLRYYSTGTAFYGNIKH